MLKRLTIISLVVGATPFINFALFLILGFRIFYHAGDPKHTCEQCTLSLLCDLFVDTFNQSHVNYVIASISISFLLYLTLLVWHLSMEIVRKAEIEGEL